MTVAELRKALEGLSDDMPVLIWGDGTQGGSALANVVRAYAAGVVEPMPPFDDFFIADKNTDPDIPRISALVIDAIEPCEVS